MSQAGFVTITSGMLPPDVPTSFVTDSGIAVPIANTLNIFGTTVAAGSIPFQFTGLGDTVTGEIQLSQAIAGTDATKVGLASFNSAQFSVDANGFVSSLGGGGSTSFNVDASTAPGTDPVIPDGGGIVTVTGAQVAAGTVGTNVIRTNSLAANTYTTEIQRSTATGVSTIASNGVSHFNSAQFSVDANGFVSSLGGGGSITLTGNSGVATPAANNINVVTANATVQFVGSGDDLTQDFGLTNLLLGSSGTSITVGTNNVGLGLDALVSLTAGSGNTAIGRNAADSLNTGSNNIAIGYNSLAVMTGSNQNVAVGASALVNMTTSTGSNTAIGYASLDSITTGTANTALGEASGGNLSGSDSSNITIKNAGTSGDNNTIRIGTQGNGSGQQNKCFVAGIVGVTVSNTQAVTIDSTTGQLGVTAVPTSITWSQVGGSGTSVKNTGEFVNAAVTRTLPVSAGLSDGDLFIYICTTAGALVIQSVGAQRIRLGNILSAAAGTATSTAIGDSIELRFNATDGFFYCCGGPQGTWTIT
jgi:hypothetical protein|tara:strand:+ start:596 stop:2188 length:1593 start_codon:yes stop_codon:yes gene_type:complete